MNAKPPKPELMASGFVPTIPLPLNALTVLRMFDGLNREVDVFVRYYIPFEELLSASEMVCVSDNMVRVASLKHVIQAKRITRRPHDLQDIESARGAGRAILPSGAAGVLQGFGDRPRLPPDAAATALLVEEVQEPLVLGRLRRTRGDDP